MDSRMLPSEGEEHVCRPNHGSLTRQSASTVASDKSFVPLVTSGLSYDDKFVSLIDMDPTFLGAETCYFPQESYPGSHDFDVRALLDSLPDQLLPLEFHDEVSYDEFASDTKFSSKCTSSTISALFLQQQQQPYAPMKREMQEDMPALIHEYTVLPSLQLLSDPSGGDSVMNTSLLYIPSDLECPGDCVSLPISNAQYQYDVIEMPLNPSLIGFPSVQISPAALPGQADLPLSSDPLRALPPLDVSGVTACYLDDSPVCTIPSTSQNNFTSNNVRVAPLGSHDLQHCSIPLCSLMQSPPSRVSSTRIEGRVSDKDLTGKMGADLESSISDTNLGEYIKAHIGLPDFSICQDAQGACLAAQISAGLAHVGPGRKHGRLGRRGRPLARTNQAHLPKIVDDEGITQEIKRKETRRRKSQSQIEPCSIKAPLISCRKRRARKSVEKKLNEAILIFNNMDSVYVEEENETITEETTAAGYPSDNSREPGTSSNIEVGAECGTRCPVNNVGCTMSSPKFCEYDCSRKDEANIKRDETASKGLGVATSVNGNYLTGKVPSHFPCVSRLQDDCAVECTNSDLQRDETLFAGTSDENRKVVCVVYNSRKDDLGSSAQQLSSFFTSDPTTNVLTLPSSDLTVDECTNVVVTAVECNEAERKTFEDSTDSLSEPDSMFKDESRANASEAKAEEIRGTDVCSEAVKEVESEMSDVLKEGADPKSAEEGNSVKSSNSAATAGLGIAVGINDKAKANAEPDSQSFGKEPSTPFIISLNEEGNIVKSSASAATASLGIAVGINDNVEGNAEPDNRSFEKEASTSIISSLNECEANNKREAESAPEKDAESDSSSTSVTTPKIAVADHSPRDADDGSLQGHPSSPLATVCHVGSSAETKHATGPDSSFLEGPSYKLLISASDKHVKATTPLDGSGEIDQGGHGQKEKADMCMRIDQRELFAVSSDPDTEIGPAANCNVEVHVECSEAFTCTSSVSDAKMDCEMSTDMRGEARFTSMMSRKDDNDSTKTDEADIICDELPAQDILRVQTSSSDSVLQIIGEFARVLDAQDTVDVSNTDYTGKFRSDSMERRSYHQFTQEANVAFSGEKLEMCAICSSDPSARVHSGEDCDMQSDLDVESSTFDYSVKGDIYRKGKAPMVHLKNPSWKTLPCCQQANPMEVLQQKENLNPYQATIMKILTDFIESGYGAGALPQDAAEVMTDEEPDIDAELRKGTIVVPSITPKCERGKVHRTRWRSVSKQGRMRSVTEAGRSSSSSLHPLFGICNSDSTLREPKTLYQPPPDKVYRTRSRSRAGWGGLRQF